MDSKILIDLPLHLYALVGMSVVGLAIMLWTLSSRDPIRYLGFVIAGGLIAGLTLGLAIGKFIGAQ